MKKIIFLLVLFIGIGTMFCFSQIQAVRLGKIDHKSIKLERIKDKKLSYARFRNDTGAPLFKNSKEVLNDLLQMRKDDELKLLHTDLDELGFTNQRYKQYYKGIRVAYGIYSLQAKDGFIKRVAGNFLPVGNVDIIPRLTESEALKCAMDHVGAEIYKWQIPEEEALAKEHWGISYYPAGELVIVKDRLKTDSIYRLAYLFDIYAHKPMSRDYIYVDAITGDIIEKNSRLRYCHNSSGWADTKYSGRKNITTDYYYNSAQGKNLYRLREWRNGTLVETYNLKNMDYSSYGSAGDFTDNDNNWTVAEHGNNSAALDIHWAAEKTYDYFLLKHGRRSWNNKGAKIACYAHWNLNYANSAWDGNRAYFGDGSANNPWTSLDAVTHEIAHGVADATFSPNYRQESGALEEALSDIWAACVEYYVTGNLQKAWLIGEDVIGGGGNMRNMSNPKSSGLSAQPNTYQGAYWVNIYDLYNDNGGVHTNSGVINYWFYLLSQGGSGTNDNGKSYSVTGIGITDAAKIVYRAQCSGALAPNADFEDFKTVTYDAATDLFGDDSPKTMAVTNAWIAVGLGENTVYTINGPASVCSGSTGTYTLPNTAPNNVPFEYADTTLIWSCSSNMQIIGNNYGRSKSLKAVGDGDAWIKVRRNGMIIAERTDIIAGLPKITTVSQPVINTGLNRIVTVTPPSHPGITEYRWVWNPVMPGANFHSNTIGQSVQVAFTQAFPGYTLFAYARNSCGESPNPSLVYVFNASGTGYSLSVSSNSAYTIYPNPVKNMLTIEIDTEYWEYSDNVIDEESGMNVSEIRTTTINQEKQKLLYDIRLYDNYGNIRRQAVSEGEAVNIDMGSMPDGIYYLHIYDGIHETPEIRSVIKE